jgi:addiction module RelE/StbE family toxin
VAKAKAAKIRTAKPKLQCIAAECVKSQFDELVQQFPEIRQALTDFNLLKKHSPPKALPDKMKDHVLQKPLQGIRECHLAPDVLLLYTHRDDVLHLLYICRHSDLYGKRQRQLAALINKLQ